jgi:hypothetical protein
LSAIGRAGPAAKSVDQVYRLLGLVAVDLATEAGLEPSQAKAIANILAS